MANQAVRKYYSEFSMKEWRRLVRDPYHRLEFDTTMHFIKKYSPTKGLVLDAGGGPGRYTIELAKLGYDVVLLDLTSELLKIAKKQIQRAQVGNRVRQILQGSVDDFSMFDDDTFDVVLCLGGALAHLMNVKRREKAIDELIRVAKKGAPIFVSVIGKLAILVCALIYWPKDLEINGLYQRIYDTGDYFGDHGIYTKGRSFAPCHFYSREELEIAF
jgi:ubiquinone/menaquinone biosynthesis C-methylase UbiE